MRLEEVDPGARPPILRRGPAHIPVDRHASVEEFRRVAPQIPVFRVTADQPDAR